MSLIARYSAKIYTPAPAGMHRAVCCDVIDLGLQLTAWGEQYRLRMVFEIDVVDPATGRRFTVSKSFRNTMHSKSRLRQDLESWRGRRFTEAEARAFDLDRLLNANATLNVLHNASADGRVFANIETILPPDTRVALLTVAHYTRRPAAIPLPRPADQSPAPVSRVDPDMALPLGEDEIVFTPGADEAGDEADAYPF